jgi:hypothetical protein
MSCKFADSFQSHPGWNEFHPGRVWKLSTFKNCDEWA